MASLYVTLILKKTSLPTQEKIDLVNKFKKLIEYEYTEFEIMEEMMNAFYNDTKIDFDKYVRVKIITDYTDDKHKLRNFAKQDGVVYHHSQLLRRNPPTISIDDEVNGVIYSAEPRTYYEPVASYTLDEMVDYCYSLKMTDEKEYTRNRLFGIFKWYIDHNDLETVLYMINICKNDCDARNIKFNIKEFGTYLRDAKERIGEARTLWKEDNNGVEQYVCKRRVLPH